MIPGMTTAILHTSLGDIRMDLFAHQAPKTVKNFVGLFSVGDTVSCFTT
jgi:cyclophilin family peptidyl-prolyl cis-trans isomerase